MEKTEREKKGLAIIYDPHHLQQFIWYYTSHAECEQWDALCLPNGYKGTYMDTYCRRINFFKKIYSDETEYLALSLFQKGQLLINMIWHYVTRHKMIFCKKILNQFVENIDEYDEIVAGTDTGFVSGLIALLGENRKIIYLDDGYGLYNKRFKWRSVYSNNLFISLQGLLMARMGYGCKGLYYFGPTDKCVKYSAVSREMHYRNYREMYDIEYSKTDINRYTQLINKAYPEIQTVDFASAECVFFTDNIEDFDPKQYQSHVSLCVEYIKRRYRHVILKKHPRDIAKYDFGNEVIVQEIDSNIPAEIILERLGGKDIYFDWFSSLIIFAHPYNLNIKIFYFNNLYNNKPSVSEIRYPDMEHLNNLCRRFTEGNFDVISLG